MAAEQLGKAPEADQVYDWKKDPEISELVAQIHPDADTAEGAAAAAAEERVQTAREKIAGKVVMPSERAAIDGLVAKTEGKLTTAEHKAIEAKHKASQSPLRSTGNAVIDARRSEANTEALAQAKADAIADKKAEHALPRVEELLRQSREKGEAGYVDIDQAQKEAEAAKFLVDREAALKFERDADGKLVERQNVGAQDIKRAEALREQAIAAGDKAGETYKADLAKNSELFVKSVGEVEKLKDLEVGSLSPIRAGKPEYTSQLVTEIQSNLGVDMAAAPMKVEKHGNRLRNNRTLDIFRESNDPDQKGIVFVEQVDRATGEVLRLDVVKAEKPSKETSWRMRRWQNKVEGQLKGARANDNFVSTASRDTEYGSSDSDGSYAAVLKHRGIAAENLGGAAGKKKLKKPRKGFLQSFFNF